MPKAIKACSSCRKHKTRCEILEHTTSHAQCHRCKVLSIDCSYKVANPAQQPSPPKTSSLSSSPTAIAGRTCNASSKDARLWSFVAPEGENVDWSQPMLAIQQLTLLPISNTASQFATSDVSLSMILPEQRVDYLIRLFDDQYTPWLNFQPIRNSRNPLVDIACSTVAARHLDGAAGAEVRLRLWALTRESLAQLVFKPAVTDSVEAVQCLLILSLWHPFGPEPNGQGWSAQAMTSKAVGMAMNLRFDHASADVNNMRKRGDLANMSEALERARLWVAITNTESMLCLGTRRVPCSRRTNDDHLVVEFPSVLNGYTDWAAVRLGLIARQLDLVQEAASARLQPDVEKDEWTKTMTRVLEQMERGERLLLPLPFVLENEQFYFHAIHVYLDISRLLVLYHAFWEARHSLPHIPFGQPWHARFMPHAPHGEALLAGWGRDMIRTNEALLVHVLALAPSSTSEPARLCTAPDALFSVVSLAAGVLVGIKFLLMRSGPRAAEHGAGASDLVLARVAAVLQVCARGHGHAAQRAALLVQHMLAKWEARDVCVSVPLPPPDTEIGTVTPPTALVSLSPVIHDEGESRGSSVGHAQEVQQSVPPIVSSTATLAATDTRPQPLSFPDMDFLFSDSRLSGSSDGAFWDALLRDQFLW